MAPKAPAKAPAKSPKAAAPPADKGGKKDDAAPEPTAAVTTTATTAPKNKEEVLAQVNLDGLPHCPNDQILEILREKYETLVAVFIHYCKQSECKTLEQATRFEVANAGSEKIDRLVVGDQITPSQIDFAAVDPDTLPFWELSDSIARYEEVGRRTTELRAKWWHKLSGPLSSVLMPLLGSIAAFGLARSGQLFLRAVIGMALGFAYFVVDNAALAMGNFGGYPPFLAAWAPFLLFFLVGETVLVRTEE